MSAPKRLQNQIKRKIKEIQQLESDRRDLDMQIMAGHEVIAALEEAVKHFDIDENPARSLRAGKSVARIYEILKENGKPLHIKEILEKLGKNTDKKSQQATGSQLNSYVREDRIFSRPEKNTFGLMEWEANANASPTSTEGVQAEWPLSDKN